MKLDALEIRMLTYYAEQALNSEQKKLAQMDQDSDEYVELANDLMVLDTVISKLKKEKPSK